MLYWPILNYFDGNLDAAAELLADPNAVPGLSDGGAHVGTICDASFPTTLLSYWCRDRTKGARFVPEWIVSRQCRATAEAVGLLDRGIIAPGFKAEGFETSTTDKAKIIEQLNQSFAYAEAAIQSMSNADFAKPEKKLGPDANDGDVIYLMVVHNHEHLGQTIAYARFNGITPPWTEEAQRKAKTAKDAAAPK